VRQLTQKGALHASEAAAQHGEPGQPRTGAARPRQLANARWRKSPSPHGLEAARLV